MAISKKGLGVFAKKAALAGIKNKSRIKRAIDDPVGAVTNLNMSDVKAMGEVVEDFKGVDDRESKDSSE